MNVFFCTTQTPIGGFHMIFDASDIVFASGFGSIENLCERVGVPTYGLIEHKHHKYQTYVQKYFKGDMNALKNINAAQTGTEFQQKVWAVLGSISAGETISYKTLAEKIGNPKAFRAAGTVCGLNKLILLVPCHRVITTGGEIGEYLYGAEIKKQLLMHEGV